MLHTGAFFVIPLSNAKFINLFFPCIQILDGVSAFQTAALHTINNGGVQVMHCMDPMIPKSKPADAPLFAMWTPLVMCVDFTDLNRVCLKYSFLLPRIDQLVDSTLGHKLLTFMDTFLGHNQIQMSEEDLEKTAFITSQELCCYRVINSGKNTIIYIYIYIKVRYYKILRKQLN